MDRVSILFHHTHTSDSNRFEEEVRNLTIKSHVTDYVKIIRNFPTNLDAVFVKTDHWKTDPEYFEQIEDRIESQNGTLRRFGSHVYFTLSGSSGVIINGVEASIGSEQFHVTIAGLPLSDDDVYYNLTLEELVAVGTRANWIAPAHIGLPFHQFSTSQLCNIIEQTKGANISTAIGYPTGYFPLYNQVARKELPFQDSVEFLAKQHDLPLLPELDLHAALPRGLSGCGILSPAVVRQLRNGVIPTKEILAADLLRPTGYQEGISFGQFLKNYASFIPFISSEIDHESRFQRSIPNSNWLGSLNVASHTIELP